jgi:hypothetical protein
MHSPLARPASEIRSRFDRLVNKVGAVPVVAVLLIITAAASRLMSAASPATCHGGGVRIIDLELTFSARRYAALIKYLAGKGCSSAFLTSLISYDVLFPIAYAMALCALYLWAERQRRFARDGSASSNPPTTKNDIAVVLPLAAGAIDILLENIPLFIAGQMITPQSAGHPGIIVQALVMIGSMAAALKWTLVLLSLLAILGEIFHADRGLVIKRLRYSVLAVLLGAVPLLTIPQGQDILQRTIEGETPWPGVMRAVAAVLIGAYIVWYCGRKLVQLKYPSDPDVRGEDWYTFYARHIPRTLGLAVILLGAAAFARAGVAMLLLIGFAVAGYVAAALIQRIRGGALTATIGRRLVPGRYRKVTAFTEAAGRAAIAIVIALPLYFIGPDSVDFARLRRIALLLLVLAWVFYLFVSHRRGRIAADILAQQSKQPQKPQYDISNIILKIEGEAVSSTRADQLDRAVKWTIAAGVIVSVAALAAFIFWPVSSARWLGSLLVLSMGVATVVFYGSIATWVHEKHGIPLAPIALVMAALFSIWNDSHIVRRLTGQQSRVSARETIGAYYDRWKADTVSRSDGPVILVAAAGGGLRAAYWTALSLAHLQDVIPGFSRNLLAVSSVSGGSVGASVYAALVRDSIVQRGDIGCMRQARVHARGEFAECVREFMADDYLSPVLAKMIAPDFVQLFLPFPWAMLDRSLGLEGSWETSYHRLAGRATLDSAFLALYDGAGRGAVPPLFLNTTHVETGKRYITAPLLRGDSAPPLGERAYNFHDSEDLLSLMGSDLRLSTAAHNSARFSYVSPPGRIQRSDTLEFGHVVDGGYFENSGLATLREILEGIREKDNGAQFIVLYLCNDPVPCNGHADSTTAPTVSRTAVSEWLGPVRAVLSTRNARGSLSRSDVADLEGVTFMQLSVCDSLVTQARSDTTNFTLGSAAREERGRDRVISPPLGWLLSRVARDWMDSSLTAGRAGSRSSACRRNNARVVADLSRLFVRLMH